VLVGFAEARHPERGSVGHRLAEVGRSGTCSDCHLERVNDPGWIVSEQLPGERRVVRPAMDVAASSEQFRQLAACFLTQHDKINGLAPGGRFLGAASHHHLTDNSW
jgi:hypothetical protein